MSRKVSSVPGGRRVTTEIHGHHKGHEDRTYNRHGELVDITHNTPDGKSHSHNIARDPLGPSKGSIKR